MRLLSLLLMFSCSAWAQLPAAVSLDELMRVVERSPRVAVSAREVDIARAERATAGALPNPTLSFSRAAPSSGERTIFDANSQQQAAIDLPVPIFGQRGARMKAADLQVGRAESQLRLTLAETKRLAGVEFVRLLGAQEALAARRAALADVERIRGLVAGRQESGMASRYDLARADAELALSRLGAQRAGTDLAEHAAALAALANAPEWRPQAAGSLDVFRNDIPETDLNGSPALRVARDETAAAEARVEVAHKERYPVPSLQLGRTWTSGPFGAANYVGVASEIPILDTRKALEDKAAAEAAAARERERAVSASVRSDFARLKEAQAVRREALARFERDVSERQGAFLEMAENAYRLGRGSLFELLDARRTQLEAALARIELAGALAETQIELRALLGAL